MACWDGTFDETPAEKEARILAKEMKRITDYEREAFKAAPLAFWLDPDRWEGLGSTNLHDPGSKPFWMKEPPAPVLPPPEPPKPVLGPLLAALPEIPVVHVPFPAQRPNVLPCGCPSYHGIKSLEVPSKLSFSDTWSICNNCGAGWEKTNPANVVWRFRERYMR